MNHESVGSELAKIAPPVVVTAGARFGWFTLQEWMCVVTIVYTVFGICYLALKIRRVWKERNK
ncbi:MAG: hypothetical protein RIN56_00075 [Sporomusaceae bacterium]|nr:hypothetical protein [Sporomusaceae bacterium]